MAFESGIGGRLRVVTDVLRSFADATTDYARLLQTIVERIGGLVGHPCSIRLLTPDGQRLASAALFDPSGDPTFAKLARATIPVTEALKGALDHQRAYVEEIVTQQGIDEVHPGGGAQRVIRVLIAPLVARGAALGCLFVVQHTADATPFTEEDVELVDALARHAALALANSRLMTSLEAVEHAREHEKIILDTILTPLVLLDKDARIVHANRALGRTFGVDLEQVTGRSLFEIADRLFDLPALRERLAALPPRVVDERDVDIATPAGVCTFRVRTNKTFRPGNGSETTLVTLTDMTERIAATRLGQHHAAIIASMSEALIGLDRDFYVQDWNPAAERLFGWTVEEVRGKPIAELFANTANNDRESNRRRLRGGETVRAQMGIVNRHGERVDVEFSTTPIFENGEPQGYVCVMLDVTARGRLERELRARVEELTTANHELESFSYSVSHDLRAPVRAIDGFSELLESEHAHSLDSEGRRMLGTVRKNAKRMGMLIDDLLALARFSRQPLVKERVDMHALARTTFEEALRAEPARDVSSTLAPLPEVFGDEGLLRQVFFNLFSNAVKYTRGRENAVIETYAAEAEDEVVYTVKDNGVGFDMRHADKLFGTFERLHTAKEFEGTGIGLALVARIVKRHGGRVWGEGEVDRGARFSFTIPKLKEGS